MCASLTYMLFNNIWHLLFANFAALIVTQVFDVYYEEHPLKQRYFCYE